MWCPFAIRDEIERPAHLGGGLWYNGLFNGAARKILWHKTQGGNYPRSTYVAGGGVPHFTVSATQIWQHFDTAAACRALTNTVGGVDPNHDGTIQIELIGYSGVEDLAVARNAIPLIVWLEANHGIPNVWPADRPAQARIIDGWAYAPYAADLISVDHWTWLHVSGHYSHSQAPENASRHWDPAFTDGEWAVVTSRPTPESAPQPLPRITKDRNMLFVVDESNTIYVLWPTAAGFRKNHVTGTEWVILKDKFEVELVRSTASRLAAIPNA